MAASSIEITVPGSNNFWHQDWAATLEAKLHEGSDELGQLLLHKVSSRTPVLTGALMADEFYKAHPKPGDKVLAEVGVGTENQMAEYNRVYALYIEGGSDGFGSAGMGLGLGSNANNGNREMFGRIFTDDIDDVVNWGEQWLQEGLNDIAAGKGIVP